MLIGVTQFFRDRDAFEALEREVLPRALRRSAPDEPVRVWVPGCATGEEAYSLAHAAAPRRRDACEQPPVQMFATDIDERALADRPAGPYPESDRRRRLADAAAPLLRPADARRLPGPQELRELVLFAVHNLLRDPPFSRLDLVSCRNLLIYLEPRRRSARAGDVPLRAACRVASCSSASSESADAAARCSRRSTRSSESTAPHPVRPVDPPARRACRAAARRWRDAGVRAAARPTRRRPTLADVHRRVARALRAAEHAGHGRPRDRARHEHAGRFLRSPAASRRASCCSWSSPELRLDLRTALVPGAADARAGEGARR